MVSRYIFFLLFFYCFSYHLIHFGCPWLLSTTFTCFWQLLRAFDCFSLVFNPFLAFQSFWLLLITFDCFLLLGTAFDCVCMCLTACGCFRLLCITLNYFWMLVDCGWILLTAFCLLFLCFLQLLSVSDCCCNQKQLDALKSNSKYWNAMQQTIKIN